jgi:hypothetical protein
VKLEQLRTNVFQLTATRQELSALTAAGRMARDSLLDDPHAPAEAVELLDRVLRDYDDALARLLNADGRT